MFSYVPILFLRLYKSLTFIQVSKDTGLTQFLPPIRAVMEAILLRVKSIIVINNCTDAFFMGSMKNRDHKGQEIPSQVSQKLS